MEVVKLFFDASLDPETKIGFGACLLFDDKESSLEKLKQQIKIKRFDHSNSVKLELQTLLWIFDALIPEDTRIIIYTDSQNILGLPGRRERLEEHDYRSKNNKRIENYELYQEFYQTVERYDCVFVKVKGHQPSSDKLEVDQLFTLVDRAARNALRNFKKVQGE